MYRKIVLLTFIFVFALFATTAEAVVKASNPSPGNGASCVDPNTYLSWTPGIMADKHDVYLGIDYDDVNNGVGGTFKGRQDPNSYDPGGLGLDTTYYWRVDEVNMAEDPNIWKGDVWSFTTWSEGVSRTWTAAGDNLWSNAANWSPAGVPGCGDDVVIDEPNKPCVINCDAECASLTVSLNNVACSLDILSGNLSVGTDLTIGANAGSTGTVNKSGGTVTVVGTIDVRRGCYAHSDTVTISGHMEIGGLMDCVGHVQLDGGTISACSFGMGSGGGTATMDITEGTLVIDGNAVSQIQDYFRDGWLTAYDGLGLIYIDHDANTTVTAKTVGEAHNDALDYFFDHDPLTDYNEVLVSLQAFQSVMAVLEDFMEQQVGVAPNDANSAITNAMNIFSDAGMFYVKDFEIFYGWPVNTDRRLPFQMNYLVRKGQTTQAVAEKVNTVAQMASDRVDRQTILAYVQSLPGMSWTPEELRFIKLFVDLYCHCDGYWADQIQVKKVSFWQVLTVALTDVAAGAGASGGGPATAVAAGAGASAVVSKLYGDRDCNCSGSINGINHEATGGGALDVAFGELSVYNTELTGSFGVKVHVEGRTRWDCVMYNFDEANTLPEGASLRVACPLHVPSCSILDEIPDHMMSKVGGQWQLDVNMVDTNSYTVEAYRNGTLVHREENYTVGGGGPVSVGKVDIVNQRIPIDFHVDVNSPLTLEWTYLEPIFWDFPPVGTPVQIDTLRVIPEDFNSIGIDLSTITMTANDIPEFTIIDVRTSGCMTAPSSMVAWWPLDETVGETSEELVNDNDGTWVGSPIPVAGMVDGALSLDATDYVSVPDSPELDFGTGDFSIDCWLKTSVTTGAKSFIDKRTGNIFTPTGYVLWLNAGKLAFIFGDGTGYGRYESALFVADGNWHHVAVTVDRDDPNGLKLYVNGVSETFNPTGYQQSLTNDGDLEMGVDTYISGNDFSGEIDEVELFNRALKRYEIEAIYRAGSDGKCKPESEREKADINDDGIVNFKDFACLANHWLEPDYGNPND